MRPSLLLGAIFLFASSAAAAGRDPAGPLTVRAAQAEVRGRPSLDATVTGLLRRGETVEAVRSSSDGRWIEVEIGAGELAWIEARAVKTGAVAPEPERRDTLRMRRTAWAEDDRRSEGDGRRPIASRRVEEAPPRAVQEPPRQTKPEPREEAPPPRQTKPEPREEAPPPRRTREEPREVHNDPPQAKRERVEPAPPPSSPPPQAKRERAEPTSPSHPPPREIPPAKPGEVFAADLDDERPPTRPGETTKRAK